MTNLTVSFWTHADLEQKCKKESIRWNVPIVFLAFKLIFPVSWDTQAQSQLFSEAYEISRGQLRWVVFSLDLPRCSRNYFSFFCFFQWLLSAASCQRTSTAQIMSHIWLYGLKPSQDLFFLCVLRAFLCHCSILRFLAQRQSFTQAVETWDQTTNPLITGHLLFNLLRLLQTITHPIDMCVLLCGLLNRSMRTHSLPPLSTHWIM